MSQKISVDIGLIALYVTGTVNGISTIWTNIEKNTWESIVEKSDDGIYKVNLSITNQYGKIVTSSFTLYYGLNLITDRTALDVEQKTEKGVYNSEDLSRVVSAMQYIANKFSNYGHTIKIDSASYLWTNEIYPDKEKMDKYINDIKKIRSLISVMDSTPECPESLSFFNYILANNIEQILLDIDFLFNNMLDSRYFSSEIYCGEV